MKKKILITLTTIACAVLLVVGSVAGTMAYLRATAEVVNTFTYGNVAITMDETQIGEDGLHIATGTTQRVVGNRYKLLPGTTYKKDPIIHIGAESEAMYLFVKIDNGIAGLAGGNVNGATELTIHEQMLRNGWKVLTLPGENDTTVTYFDRSATTTQTGSATLIATSTVYYYAPSDHANGAQVINADKLTNMTNTTGLVGMYDVPTFADFTLTSSTVAESIITAYVNNNAKITVTAFGVQCSGFDDIFEAATVFESEFKGAITNGTNNGVDPAEGFDTPPAPGNAQVNVESN